MMPVIRITMLWISVKVMLGDGTESYPAMLSMIYRAFTIADLQNERPYSW